MVRYRLLGIVLAGILVLALGVGALAQNNWGQVLTGKTESVTGTVVAVDLEAPTVSVTVRVGENGNLVVELGPVWALKDLSLKEGDVITVVGERVNENTMVAYSVGRGDANGNTVTLTLRDANGKPTWSGTPGQKEGNKYRNRNRVTLQAGNTGQTSGNTYQSGPQDGSGNQWQNNANQGQGNQHQSGPQDGSGNQWGRR